MNGWRSIWVQLEPITGDVCGFALSPFTLHGFPNSATEFVPVAATEESNAQLAVTRKVIQRCREKLIGAFGGDMPQHATLEHVGDCAAKAISELRAQLADREARISNLEFQKSNLAARLEASERASSTARATLVQVLLEARQLIHRLYFEPLSPALIKSATAPLQKRLLAESGLGAFVESKRTEADRAARSNLCPYCDADTSDGSVCARCHPAG